MRGDRCHCTERTWIINRSAQRNRERGIDRQLAADAIDAVDCAAAGAPKDRQTCEKEPAKAAEALSDGDAALAEAQTDGMDFDKAVDDFKRAWEKAVEAAEKGGTAAATAAASVALPTEL